MPEWWNKVGNFISGLRKSAKGDDMTGVAGMPQEASQGNNAEKNRNIQKNATNPARVYSGQYNADGTTGSNPDGGFHLDKAVDTITDAVDTIRTGYETGKSFTDVEKEKREREAAAKKNGNNNNTNNNSNNNGGGNTKVTEDQKKRLNPEETEEEKAERTIEDQPAPNYNLKAEKALKANGLDKYMDEDGNIDYKRLERSKVGWKVLQGLGSAMAAFGSGMTGKNFDASNGFASQELAKRQEVQDAYKDTAEDELGDQRQMDTLAKELKLTNAAKKDFEKVRLRYGRENDAAILDFIKGLPAEDRTLATKIMARTNTNSLEELFNTVTTTLMQNGGNKILAKVANTTNKIANGGDDNNSDEKCKSFARRSVFK